MAQVITFAGEQLFATKAQNNQPLDIDTFIFAMVPGQDPNAPINRAEALPPIGQRVHTQIVQQTGKVNDNVVIYSTVLDSTTGPFEFNWVGLYSSVNSVLVAIQHIPTTPKTITVPGAAGNTLNRNFGIEYSGIAELAGITVEPETWQLDYTARLNGMDELTRQLAADMNGKDWFIGDGFKVEPRSTLNTFKVTAGAGYVSGLRVELEADHILTLSAYPRFVYVDAWFDGTSESVWKGQAAFTVTSAEMDDYIDVNGKQHYVCKLASITAAEEVIDLRNIEGLADKIKSHKHDDIYQHSFQNTYEMIQHEGHKIGNSYITADTIWKVGNIGQIHLGNGLYAKLESQISVTATGALGGVNDDTTAFEDALNLGEGSAFVPFRNDGYTVNKDLEGLWGFGEITFNGSGLVRYKNAAEYKGYKTASFYADVLARNGNVEISCFGDSTMYGYQVGGATSDVQDVNNPPNILVETLRAVFHGDITIYNEGISGSNMRGMMRDLRFEGKIAPGGTNSGSHIIYCNHCINNAQSPLPIEEFKKDYVEFVRICRKYNKVPVIVTPNPLVPIGGGDAIKTRVIEAYVNAMRDVAKSTGCDIVDNYYYAMQTASKVPLSTLVPDGIHPSSQLYLQNGRNMAIPLISAATLKNKGDVANIYACSMKDTASSGTTNQLNTLSGLSYNSNRNNEVITGINFAVIFNEKFDYLNLHALQWESGARVKVRSFNHNTTEYWQTIDMARQYGNANSFVWDTPFLVKSNGDSYAGLHIIEASYDIAFTDSVRNQMALNCISVADQFSSQIRKIGSFGRYQFLNESLLTNQTMTLDFNFTPGGEVLSFTDYSGFEVLRLSLTEEGVITAEYFGSFENATDIIVASGAVAGVKNVSIKIEPIRVTISVDSVEVIRVITAWMPPLKISNSGVNGFVTNN